MKHVDFARLKNLVYAIKLIKMEENVLKLALTGSIFYENKRKIREYIFSIRERCKKDETKLVIYSAGKNIGADKYIKKFALELEIDYFEFNPSYSEVNLYSFYKNANYYGKNKSLFLDFLRNKIMATKADRVIIFQKSGDKSMELAQFKKDLEKMNKNPIIVN